MESIFQSADILLPDFKKTDGTRWAVVACDQYTSDAGYWKTAENFVGDAPSTLRLMLPEIYLGKDDATRIEKIHAEMKTALQTVLQRHSDCMIYLERRLEGGKVRRGLIGKIDLETYDYNKGSTSLIRATEGTVLERIPPRVAVRRGAPLEMPHVLLLIDDPERTVIEPLSGKTAEKLYDFDLMAGGGHVCGYALSKDEQEKAVRALAALSTPEVMKKKYGSADLAPLLFAVGDGNHSLASAKAYYEEIKAKLGAAALSHPARYALCEVNNLHDDDLEFEPIYRVVFGADPKDLTDSFRAAVSKLTGAAKPQSVTVLCGKEEETIQIPSPEKQLPVGTVQAFLDEYLASHPGVRVDYIHGTDAVRRLVAENDGNAGFLFAGMEKDQLFRTVMFDGALPRKTFSMGRAQDKRFYLECRKIEA
ncbi:MAG: DUF1015 domain-containing protein [Ruminococcaceae bacterium]|nr:DUF1015 domain-containing protein [Oscillospiraceae bacterium]